MRSNGSVGKDMYNMDRNMSLIKVVESWATTENPFHSTQEILSMIEKRNREAGVKIEKIDFDYEGSDWHYEKGEIRNANGTFFRITGLRQTIDGKVIREQPIIVQNEIGYLGIIAKEFDGTLYFLMQMKIEPGNVNKVQISPTIQATKSNFMQTHGGKTPAYLEYFVSRRKHEIIVDQIQSEQSSRFLGKRNRNIIILVEDEVKVLDSHLWMTLGQIKELMQYDNLVNMDTRSVISCIPFALRDFSFKELRYLRTLFHDESFFNSVFFGEPGAKINRIYQYINDVKMLDQSRIRLVDLDSLQSWRRTPGGIEAVNGPFRVIYCNIEIEGREVRKWQQPMLEAAGESVFGLICCVTDQKMEFLIQTKNEVGCFDKVEMGPSVQLEKWEGSVRDPVSAFFISRAESGKGIMFDGLFSEEGGRFFHEQNRNIIMRIDKEELPFPLPEGFFWADFQTLNILIQFNNCLNIQLRNLLSILRL